MTDLVLEEIAAKFGDEVAVDLSHLSDERRRALDESLIAMGADHVDTPSESEKVDATITEKI